MVRFGKRCKGRVGVGARVSGDCAGLCVYVSSVCVPVLIRCFFKDEQ